jgi:hypothetical protein
MSETTIGPLVCLDCDTVLQAAPAPNSTHDAPCPNCGSRAQKLLIGASDAATAHDDADLKARPTGSREVLRHVKSGSELFRRAGEWQNRHRDIDFEHDHYVEVITNESGNVVRSVDEPLSKHRGRGTAKHKKPAP